MKLYFQLPKFLRQMQKFLENEFNSKVILAGSGVTLSYILGGLNILFAKKLRANLGFY